MGYSLKGGGSNFNIKRLRVCYIVSALYKSCNYYYYYYISTAKIPKTLTIITLTFSLFSASRSGLNVVIYKASICSFEISVLKLSLDS